MTLMMAAALTQMIALGRLRPSIFSSFYRYPSLFFSECFALALSLVHLCREHALPMTLSSKIWPLSTHIAAGEPALPSPFQTPNFLFWPQCLS